MSGESESFFRSLDNLKNAIANHDDTELLKRKALALQNQLNQISEELPPYDLQKYSTELSGLLRQINSEAPVNVVKLHFKKKPKGTFFRQRSREVAMGNGGNSPTVSDQDFNITESNTTYKDLLRCTITGKHFIDDTGALTFKYLESCIINIYEPTFHQGSIILDHCNQCAIYIHTCEGMQLRLHNLQRCKLMIKPSKAPQEIVMEHCRECLFDETCKAWVAIHEFDNLRLMQQESRNYTFLPLGDWW